MKEKWGVRGEGCGGTPSEDHAHSPLIPSRTGGRRLRLLIGSSVGPQSPSSGWDLNTHSHSFLHGLLCEGFTSPRKQTFLTGKDLLFFSHKKQTNKNHACQHRKSTGTWSWTKPLEMSPLPLKVIARTSVQKPSELPGPSLQGAWSPLLWVGRVPCGDV